MPCALDHKLDRCESVALKSKIVLAGIRSFVHSSGMIPRGAPLLLRRSKNIQQRPISTACLLLHLPCCLPLHLSPSPLPSQLPARLSLTSPVVVGVPPGRVPAPAVGAGDASLAVQPAAGDVDAIIPPLGSLALGDMLRSAWEMGGEEEEEEGVQEKRGDRVEQEAMGGVKEVKGDEGGGEAAGGLNASQAGVAAGLPAGQKQGPEEAAVAKGALIGVLLRMPPHKTKSQL